MLQDNTDYLRRVAPDVLGFHAPSVWTPEMAERHIGRKEAWVYEESGVIMSLVTYRLVRIDGALWFQPIDGAIRASRIPDAEHEAYLYMPLRGAVPEAMAQGVTSTLVHFSAAHARLDTSLRGFSTADDTTIVDKGDGSKEYRTPLRLDEITAKSAPIEGRDITATGPR